MQSTGREQQLIEELTKIRRCLEVIAAAAEKQANVTHDTVTWGRLQKFLDTGVIATRPGGVAVAPEDQAEFERLTRETERRE